MVYLQFGKRQHAMTYKHAIRFYAILKTVEEITKTNQEGATSTQIMDRLRLRGFNIHRDCGALWRLAYMGFLCVTTKNPKRNLWGGTARAKRSLKFRWRLSKAKGHSIEDFRTAVAQMMWYVKKKKEILDATDKIFGDEAAESGDTEG